MEKLSNIFNYPCKYQSMTGATAMSTLYFMDNESRGLSCYGVFLTAALAAKGARQHALNTLAAHDQQPPSKHERSL